MARAFGPITVVVVVVVIVVVFVVVVVDVPKNGVNNTEIYLSHQDKSPGALRRSVYYANRGVISIGARVRFFLFHAFAQPRPPFSPSAAAPVFFLFRRPFDNRSRTFSIFNILLKLSQVFFGPDVMKIRVAIDENSTLSTYGKKSLFCILPDVSVFFFFLFFL